MSIDNKSFGPFAYIRGDQMKRNISNKVLRFYLRHFRHYAWYFVIPIIFAIFMAFYESFSPYLIKILLDRGTEYRLSNQFWSMVIWPAIIYIIFTEVVNLLFRSRDYFEFRVRPRVKASIIDNLYSDLLQYRYEYFQNSQVGNIANKINELVKGVEVVIDFVIEVVLWRSFSIMIAAIWLSMTNTHLTFVVIIWSLAFVFGSYMMSKGSHKSAVAFAKTRGNLFGYINDSLSNILSIKSFNGKKLELANIGQHLQKHVGDERNMLWGMFKISFFQGTAVTVFIAFITFILLYNMSINQITVGDFAFVMIVAGTIVRNVYSISTDIVKFSVEFGNYSAAIEALSVPDAKEASAIESLHVNEGCIELRDITFKYNSGPQIFTQRNLVISGGSKVGIVGMSGGGKSTLANLIVRLFDTQLGDITIDGQSIGNVSLTSLRENIAYIPQEPILFNRSILENIAYGKVNATLDEIKKCAELADCAEFIAQLPQQYATTVGERGVKLSGGQRQRIALARAFLKNAKILILDEPTAALDAISEEKLQQAIFSLMQGKTTLVIAHRLSTLRKMDRLFVIDGGNIVEEGTHMQLLAKNGLYKSMWDSQSKGFLTSS